MNPQAATVRRRWPLVLIGTLFLGPFIAAYILYFYFPQVRPAGAVNHGQLVDPARPLPMLGLQDADGKPAPPGLLRDKWSLIYIGQASCDEACAHRLYLTRQVRTRLNGDRSRVQRVYLAPDAAALGAVRAQLGAEHPDMLWLVDTDAPGQRFSDFVDAKVEGEVYLTDPLGNWVMSYQPDFEPAGLYKDLKHLLKLSGIG